MANTSTTSTHSRLLKAEEICDMVNLYTNGQDKKVLIPVLVNYAPIMLTGYRNYFLCIVCHKDSATLGFTTEITSRGLGAQNIPYSALKTYIKNATLCYGETPEITPPPREEFAINSLELITSLGLQSVGALSIVTNEFDYVRELISDPSTPPEMFDTILKNSIDMQSRFDSFVRQFTGRRMDDNFPKYAELRYLNHVISTNVDMTGGPNYLNTIISAKGSADIHSYLENVPMCLEDTFSIRVMNPDFETLDVVPTNYVRHGEYFITALGFIKDDFGSGSISGLPVYTPTANTYLLALMCNDKAFRKFYNNKANNVYNNRYLLKDNPGIGVTVEYNPKGNITFPAYLTGKCFSKQ